LLNVSSEILTAATTAFLSLGYARIVTDFLGKSIPNNEQPNFFHFYLPDFEQLELPQSDKDTHPVASQPTNFKLYGIALQRIKRTHIWIVRAFCNQLPDP